MLRRPFESAPATLVRMMNHGGGPALPQRQVERLEHQFGAQVGFHRPADDSAAESVEHHRQVKKPGSGRDVSYVGDPQSIGRRGDEVAFDQVGCRPRAALSHRGRPLTPRIVAGGGDSEYPAHRGNPVYGLIRVHELERRDGTEPVSVANQAAAFDSISRSLRSTRFSRRKRLSSSRSAVVSPSLRRPSSSPACLTHLRIALAEASNSRANCAFGRPVRANSMIRRRYSGAYGGWVLGIGDLLLPFSPTPSTKAGQLHFAERWRRSETLGQS